jgi:ferredoxin
MSAIDKNTLSIDLSKCIRCFRCAKKCPKTARKIEYRFKPVVTKVLRIRGKGYKKPCCIL